MTATFYGVYRGRVEANVDPLQRGRVQVSVPSVLGEGRLAWAERCVPYAGSKVGGFAVPPVGAAAWVQFEAGDPDYPVLAGCSWGTGESPAPGIPQVLLFATDGITITLSTVPGAGGITVEVGAPAVPLPMKLLLGAQGIEMSIGASSVKLDGAKVSVNNGALDVM
ncbi:MAG: phage baseplate assembly protein V [Actinomycetota bacterium]|nr:phage baseplate assembly protein V [Actinomycetota bacterium]